MTRTFTIFPALLLLTLAGTAASAGQAEVTADNSSSETTQAALEKAFSAKLSGAALVGRYSVDGRDEAKPPSPERYELESVTKLKNDYWVFLARVKYGDVNVKLPITLKVLWAGDTPMISLTNLTIPGLGSELSARVIFHGDRYAGTWQHGKAGGHMWGRIEKAERGEGRAESRKR